MFRFEKQTKYTRREIHEIIKGPNAKSNFAFDRTGYGRIDEDLFAFINIGFPGQAGHDFPNRYDEESELLTWYGKKETNSKQPLMQQIISGFLTVYCFARWEDGSDFTFLGIGKVLSFKDGVEVHNVDGNKTHSIEFMLSCKTESTDSLLINNFDESFEEGLSSLKPEGAVRYRQHKTRERNREIVKKKKREFKEEHGSLFCEVCLFEFSKTYGQRGNDFIECHHNVPLHVETNERATKTTDLSLLCSNCHRMIHRRKRWLTVEELKQLYKRHV